jgi:hypothetical protein
MTRALVFGIITALGVCGLLAAVASWFWWMWRALARFVAEVYLRVAQVRRREWHDGWLEGHRVGSDVDAKMRQIGERARRLGR